MDPALRELMREDGGPDDEVAVILRLRSPDRLPAGVRVVASFGDVVTARLLRSDIARVWGDADSLSVKASHHYHPEVEPSEADAEPEAANDDRRPPGLGPTGRGVVIGVVDWGCDFGHPDLRHADGTTRLLGLWDQRPSADPAPAPYGYGRAFGPADLDRALAEPDPYAALRYHPADFDAGLGAHGTHTMSIAAGNGRGGGPSGIAPEAACAFVNLGRREGPDVVPLGSSVELLEALDYLVGIAGDRPLVCNLSLGRQAGEHTGCTLVERAMDHLLSSRSGTAVTQSGGNYYARRAHGAWQVHAGDRRRFAVEVDPADRTPNEVDIWYSGRDRFTVGLASRDLDLSAAVPLGESATLEHEGDEIARVYHRARDPNNGDNQCSIVCQPYAAAPVWDIALTADDVVDGRVHAWIERDSGCRTCQSKLPTAEADPRTTTGTIANGYRTLVVGAADVHGRQPKIAAFSSCGPTRDGRQKPDLVAAGHMVLGARSHAAGPTRHGLYVRMSGSSMAAPAVAGTVALLFQQHGRLPIADVRRAVLAGCTPLPDTEDPRRTGAGLLSVAAALEAATDVAAEREEVAVHDEADDAIERPPPEGEAEADASWEVAPDSPAGVRVAVVGAGLSGLMAASRLAEARFAVTLFEASDRVGGRVWTRSDVVKGKVVEAGAELIGTNHPLWTRLADAHGLKLRKVTREEDYARRRRRVRFRLGDRDLTPGEMEAITKRLGPVLDRIGEEARPIDRLQPWTAPRAADWDGLSVARRLRQRDMFGPDPEPGARLALRYLEFVVANDQCAPTSAQSYLGLLAAVSAHRVGDNMRGYWKHTEACRCAGGNQQLATRLAGPVRRVLLSSPVDSIQLSPEKARVAFSHERTCTYEDFDYVILATPPRVWPTVLSDPPFRPQDYTVADGPAVKHLSAFDTDFWERAKQAPAALWDRLGSVWESTDGQGSEGPFGLSVYSGGPIVPSPSAYPELMESLFRGYRQHVRRQLLIDWPGMAWCKTGYSVPAPGQVTTVSRNLSRPFQGRLFFAGEQASPGFFGYMEGALDAGLRAAGQVAVAARRAATVPPTRTADAHEAALASAAVDTSPPPADWAEAAACVPAPEPEPAGGAPHPVVRKGSRRPAVGYAQQCLNEFLARHQAGTAGCPPATSEVTAFTTRALAAMRAGGQLPLVVDCRFGDGTERGVRVLQACFGLDRDGVVGKDTWPVLKRFDPRAPAVGTRFRVLLDTRRDGTLVAAGPGWRWGAAGHGAVVLVNNDDDGTTGRPDNEDAVIDPGDDASELASLVIESTPPAPFGTLIELEASEPASLRIFGATGPGASEIIGPATGARHRFVTTFWSRHELRMEAMRYPAGGFGGEVTLTLRATVPLQPPEIHTVAVRIAPWIMPSHLDRAETVYVVDAGSHNDRFRTELRTLVTAAGCALDEIASSDIWAQDCMEFGFASVPGKTLRTVLRVPRSRPLRIATRALLAKDLGYAEVGSLAPETDFDAAGNLETSPPVTVRGKRYPFGRIYYGPGHPGDEIDGMLRDFLAGQTVQRPFEVDTSWLTVGHVDEVISFVPAPGRPGFRLLLASARRAYAMLDRLARSDGTARMLVGRSVPTKDGPVPPLVDVERSVTEFLALRDDFNPGVRATYAGLGVTHHSTTLRRYNEDCQAHIDGMRAVLTAELGLGAADIVEIPSIFMPNPKTPPLADALVPGMVNMLVINGHCIVPKPFGPIVSGVDRFEEDVRHQLTPLGLTVSFLDCWEEYHVNLGEVHCATNTLRQRGPAAWWEFEP